jgi:4-diphosphocytidyl-2-C-methyl-D-erythritol kinase
MPARDYEIALAQPVHVAALAAIELSAATLFRGFAPAAPVLGEHTPFEVFQAAQQEQRLWVALADEVPVGFALVSMLANERPHLLEMDVLPEHGRRGVGSALLSAVCEWVSRNGYRQITLTTFRAVAWNMPFYARFGFVEVPTEHQDRELRAIVEDERARGLDPMHRVVMVFSIVDG